MCDKNKYSFISSFTSRACLAVIINSWQASVADVVFTESFEAPVVSGFSQNSVPSGSRWIGATSGFGATNRGLYSENVIWPAAPPFSTPFGAQAYYLNYSNSGLTTAVGATGQTLTANVVYKLSFNAAVPVGISTGNYQVELVAFAAADNNTARVNAQGTRPGAVLATATGVVTSRDMSVTPFITFTPNASNPNLGRDLGIRIIKNTGSVLYDNFRLIVGHDLNPTPASGVTISGGNINLSWTNMPPVSPATSTPVDVYFGTNQSSLAQVVDGQIITSTTVSAPAAATYFWRVDSYPDGNANGTPVVGDVFQFIVTDTDNDGLPDSFELAYTLPPSNVGLVPSEDIDGDGLTNMQEFQFNTLPNNSDTDSDTLLDGAEISGAAPRPATNPRLLDTDSDGLSDGVENNSGIWVSTTNTGTSPTDADRDNDGLKDGAENKTGIFVSRTTTTGTDPYLADTDNDGAGDWYEVAATLTNPNSAVEKSSVPYPLPDPVPSDAGNPNKPVKVFIMSGQSNMVGIGFVSGGAGSLDTITRQENKFPNFINSSNAYTKRNDVIYKGVVTATAQGPLTAGQGSESSRVGVELGFGHIMGWYHDEPVLLLKASEGNRSLAWDFASPSATQFTHAGRTYPAYGQSPQSWVTGTTPVPVTWYAGLQYDMCFRNEADWPPAGATQPALINAYDVLKNGVLQNLPTTDTNLNGRSYEIAGFVWWQGHKDQYDAGHYTTYERNLVRLIGDLRTEFNAPQAPFVVATIGFDGGNYAPNSPYDQIYKAQKAIADPVKYPAFVGNVKSVDTLAYWRTTEESPGTQGFHYNNNAETYTLVGDAMGRAMLELLDETDPPAPNPPTFSLAPTPVNATTIGMVATLATDVSAPVQYYFENITNTTNSGWITSNTWQSTGLTEGITYSFRFKVRDSQNNETSWSSSADAAPGLDMTAPTPNPLSFTTLPIALGENSISMTAATASDINGVLYEFICTAGGGPNSAPQASSTFVATGLTPGTSYTYVVRAIDAIGNQTADSAAASATTTAPDTTAPTPNPMTFAVPPTAQGQTTITMTATTAVDPSGVEYYFDCLTPGSTDSGWQNSAIYTHSGLTANTEYTYQVQVRDKSPAQNTGVASTALSVTTDAPDITPPVIVSLSPADNASGVSPSSNLVVTFDEVVNPTTGTITIKNLSDANQTVIDITDAAQVIVTGSVLTINPTANLLSGKNFAVQISSGAFEDDAGNSFDGISNDVAWSFETPTVQPPTGIATSTFETTLSPWTANSASGTGRYNSGTPRLLQPADDTTTNFAVTGNGAASIGKATGELTSPTIDLAGGGATESATLSLNFMVHNGTTTRKKYIDFSNDGGSTWFTIARIQFGSGSVANKTAHAGTVTIREGSSTVALTGNLVARDAGTAWAGAAFTSNVRFRIRNVASATADVRLFVDDLAVTSTIPSAPADSVRPTLTSITDDKSGGPVDVNTPVNYTVTFSEDIAAAGVTAADFSNAGAASLIINSVTETTTTSGIFTVQATPTSAGTLRLQINQDALIEDNAANDLITTSALPDDTTITVGSVSPFQTWSNGASFAGDANDDGVANALAWVLGAPSPNAAIASLMPTIELSSTPSRKLLFIYRRASAAANAPNTTISVEYSTTLGAWTTAVHQGTGPNEITITEVANGFGVGIDRVSIAIPASLANGNKLFCRLKVIEQ